MKKKTLFILSLIILLALVLPQVAQAMDSENYSIDWMVPLTGAGGRQVSSENYSLNLTVGQSVVGSAESASYQTRLGFWQDFLSIMKIYLPLVLK